MCKLHMIINHKFYGKANSYISRLTYYLIKLQIKNKIIDRFNIFYKLLKS